ncbi:MAG: DMT family transporter [Chloroflexota bacterium]|nr:DMT family transporter [Chloroflexota bacterium]
MKSEIRSSQPTPAHESSGALLRAKALPNAMPPVVLVLLAVVSVQVGAAFAKGLFPALGSLGTVFVRVGFAAIVLLVAWRPRIRRGEGVYTRVDYLSVVLFGIALAAMNATFYAALSRIPLGIAVTLEFVGPLAVAVFGSRRPLDLLWAVLAAVGILLLAPIGQAATIDPIGIAFALTAGGCWAAYILLSARVGRAFPGGSGLALSMAIAAVLLAPMGIWQAGTALLDPQLLFVGAAVAMLSSVIPYSLELEALRRLPAHVFGVLLSTEPAIAALAGFVILAEALNWREMVALALITIAAVGASRHGMGGHKEGNVENMPG